MSTPWLLATCAAIGIVPALIVGATTAWADERRYKKYQQNSAHRN